MPREGEIYTDFENLDTQDQHEIYISWNSVLLGFSFYSAVYFSQKMLPLVLEPCSNFDLGAQNILADGGEVAVGTELLHFVLSPLESLGKLWVKSMYVFAGGNHDSTQGV